MFFSIRPSPSSSGVNALTQNWECLYVSTDGTRPESVAEVEASTEGPDPYTGGPVLAQPAVVPPTDADADGSAAAAISQRDDLLKNTVTGKRYPKREAMRLTVWPLSAIPSLTADFQQMLLTRQPEPDESQLARFMVPVLDTTPFAGYRSAIAAIHQGFPDGSTVSSNTDLSTLLKGIFVVAARPRTLRETWDLPTVLKYLAGPLFEPLHAAPLKSVAIKTAFLIQLASARRVSWVHSCRIDPT